MHMLTLIKRLIKYRVAQKSAKSAARLLGFGRLASLVGLIGGLRALRTHHRHA
jgi:hypothetical protein